MSSLLGIYSKVFEDNNGALILAISPQMTPHSKHIGIEYLFFKQHVCPLVNVDTKDHVPFLLYYSIIGKSKLFF